MALARLNRLCRQAGVAKVAAGPNGVALTLRPDQPGSELDARFGSYRSQLSRREDRLVLAIPDAGDEAQLQTAIELVESL